MSLLWCACGDEEFRPGVPCRRPPLPSSPVCNCCHERPASDGEDLCRACLALREEAERLVMEPAGEFWTQAYSEGG